MKNYIVALDGLVLVNYTDIDLDLLFKSADVKKTANGDILFSLESTLAKSANLEAHIDNILNNEDIVSINQILPCVDKLYVNIGVFYDTATCTVILPNESMVKLLSAFPKIYVRTVCYPCDEEIEGQS